MKAVAAILALAATAMAAQDYYKMFVDWTMEHGKTYANAGEHAKRFENFKSNVALINLLNRQNSGATFALNKFADMSQEEFAATYLHPMKVPATREARRRMPVNLKADYPESLNWVEEGAVNAVKDQGSCGSCYAFSALCNMEGAYFLTHGELPNLAEQQIVDCESDCISQDGYETCDAACDGGLMPNVYTYAIREGMMPTSSYAYTGTQGTCKYSASKAKYAFSDWYFVDADEDSMVAALNTAGPLSVGVDATYWSYYSSGIYSSSCSTTTMNHGVALVGYGVSSSKKYWIIRNSWGTSWGEDGYLKLLRGSNKCGVNNYVCSIVA